MNRRVKENARGSHGPISNSYLKTLQRLLIEINKRPFVKSTHGARDV
jgi:hypothetical protein